MGQSQSDVRSSLPEIYAIFEESMSATLKGFFYKTTKFGYILALFNWRCVFYFVLQCFAPFVLYKNLLFCNNGCHPKVADSLAF